MCVLVVIVVVSLCLPLTACLVFCFVPLLPTRSAAVRVVGVLARSAGWLVGWLVGFPAFFFSSMLLVYRVRVTQDSPSIDPSVCCFVATSENQETTTIAARATIDIDIDADLSTGCTCCSNQEDDVEQDPTNYSPCTWMIWRQTHRERERE